MTTGGRCDVESPSLIRVVLSSIACVMSWVVVSSSVELIVVSLVAVVAVVVGSVVAMFVVCACLVRLVLMALSVFLVALSVELVPASRRGKVSGRMLGGVQVYALGLSRVLLFVFVYRVGIAVLISVLLFWFSALLPLVVVSCSVLLLSSVVE